MIFSIFFSYNDTALHLESLYFGTNKIFIQYKKGVPPRASAGGISVHPKTLPNLQKLSKLRWDEKEETVAENGKESKLNSTFV